MGKTSYNLAVLHYVGIICVVVVHLTSITAGDEIGDCENLENPAGRNKIHNGSVEVDPCTPLVLHKCLKGEGPQCAVRGDGESPYALLVSEFDLKIRHFKFAATIPFLAEFYVHAHTSNAEGKVDEKSEKIGYFMDNVFSECNSFACCDATAKGRPNVARRCPTADAETTAIEGKEGFYGITYMWFPPYQFKGYVVLVGTISESPKTVYTKVTSQPVYVDSVNGYPSPDGPAKNVSVSPPVQAAPSQPAASAVPTPQAPPPAPPPPKPTPKKKGTKESSSEETKVSVNLGAVKKPQGRGFGRRKPAEVVEEEKPKAIPKPASSSEEKPKPKKKKKKVKSGGGRKPAPKPEEALLGVLGLLF